jgi:hypothetical protein
MDEIKAMDVLGWASPAGLAAKTHAPPNGDETIHGEPRIGELLQAFPTIPATVIAERMGWDRSITALR